MSQPLVFIRQSLYDLLVRVPNAINQIREIVKVFYDVMELDEKAKTIRQMHPGDLTFSLEKPFMFLCAYTSGSQVYIEDYGLPFLRHRH